MRKIFTLVILLSIVYNAFSQTLVNQSWADNTDTPNAIISFQASTFDASGNLITAGNTYQVGQSENFLVVKTDPSGDILWQRYYNGSADSVDFATDVTTDGNNVYVTGVESDTGNASYTTTLKYDSAGNLLWTAKFNNPYTPFRGYSAPTSIRMDNFGYIYVAGTLEITNGEYWISLIKYKNSGGLEWYTSYHSPQRFDGAVSLNINGPFVYVYSVMDSNELALATFDATTGNVTEVDSIGTANDLLNTAVGMVRDAGDNLYIAAVVPTPANGNDVEVIAFDTLFNILWVDTIDGGYGLNDSASSITIDANYNIAVTGYGGTSSGTQYWTFELSSTDGSMLWSNALPATGGQGNSLITDASANVYVTGKVNSGGYNKQLTIAYDQSGNTLWQELYAPDPTAEYEGHSITVDVYEGVYVYGRNISTTTTAYTTVKYAQWSPIPCGADTCPTITYAFGNNHMTTSGTDTFIEFDLLAKSAPGLSFKSGSIILTYSESMFGDSLIHYSDISVTRGGVTADTNYKFYLADTLFQSDAVKADEGEIWLSVASAGSGGLYMLPDSIRQLCHIKIKRQHRGADGIAFDQFFMENGSYFFNGDYGEYTSVLVGAPLDDVDSIQFVMANDSVDDLIQHLDFDIIANATVAGAMLGDYQIQVNFNPIVFDSVYVTNIMGWGDDACACGGGGCCGGDSIYDFGTTLYPGAVLIQMSANANYDVTETSNQTYDSIIEGTVVAHVRLHIINCHYMPDVAIDPSSWASWEDTTNPYAFTQYTPVTIGQGFNDTICILAPQVNDWGPECINAGTFEEVTITGYHFGGDTGAVYFNNANSPGSFVSTLPQDIRYWDDNTIRLIVPSAVSGIAGTGTAGSGIFFVRTALGIDNSADSLRMAISYANYNIRTSDSIAHFVFLRDTPYVFQLSSSLFLTAGILQSVQSVFSDLRCQTGINFWVDSINAAAVDTPNAYDNVNLISEQPITSHVFSTSTPFTAAITTSNPSPCSSTLPQYGSASYFINDIDITFNTSPSSPNIVGPCGWNWWLYFTNLDSLSQFDAPSILTHELGHAAGLYHALPQKTDSRNVMYPIIEADLVQRGYDNDSNSILGVKYVLSLGDTLGTSGGCPFATPAYPSACPTVIPTTCVNDASDGIKDIPSGTGFSVYLYPNPYQDNTIVHIDVSQYGDYSISLYDIVGHLIQAQNIATNTSFDIPLSGFHENAGMYLIRVSDSHSSVVLKLIKL